MKNYSEKKCIHNKRKYECKDCNKKLICIHNKNKKYCKECGGSRICIHNKIKQSCKICCPNNFCKHNKRKYRCIVCKKIKNSELCSNEEWNKIIGINNDFDFFYN